MASSFLNVVGGFVRPTGGTIRLEGREIQDLPPHRVATLGVGRAFQFVELFPHMTVLDNLMLGRHRPMRAGLLAGALYLGPSRALATEYLAARSSGDAVTRRWRARARPRAWRIRGAPRG